MLVRPRAPFGPLGAALRNAAGAGRRLVPQLANSEIGWVQP